MKNQDEIRDKLNEYIKNNGIKAKYISQKINAHDYEICRFRSGKMNLNEDSIKLLEKYLKDNIV